MHRSGLGLDNMSMAPFLDRLPSEVTENIVEHLKGDHGGLKAFRALRLTWKKLYFQTFRVLGINYFSKISVALNAASLHHLQELAGHENSFGFSLTSFPESLTCSTYRLLTGDAVRQPLITILDPAKSLDAEDAARTNISRMPNRTSIAGKPIPSVTLWLTVPESPCSSAHGLR